MHGEQNELIGELVQAIDGLKVEREAHHQERAEMALAVVSLERLASSMSMELERLKSRLARMTTSGRPAG